MSPHIASSALLPLIGLLKVENTLLHYYLMIKTGHETLSATFLDTLPSPLKNLDTPVKPTLPITIRSTFSFVAKSTILSDEFPSVMNMFIEIPCASRFLFLSSNPFSSFSLSLYMLLSCTPQN